VSNGSGAFDAGVPPLDRSARAAVWMSAPVRKRTLFDG